MKSLKTDFYETQDLNLVAYLIAAGFCRLDGINNQDGWKKTFVITPEPPEKAISSYYNGTGQVSALELCNQLRSLKAAIRVKEGKNGNC
jgi:hypothetical protein